jgi:hypothetical protein
MAAAYRAESEAWLKAKAAWRNAHRLNGANQRSAKRKRQASFSAVAAAESASNGGVSAAASAPAARLGSCFSIWRSGWRNKRRRNAAAASVALIG